MMDMDLYSTPPRNLDKFIEDYLRPDSDFTEDVGKIIDTICTFLKETCFRDSGSGIKVLKVVKGGSSGKGTALKNESDADLVVFLDCFKSYIDQKTVRQEILNEIDIKLQQFQKTNRHINIHFNGKTQRSLSFKLQVRAETEWIKCDVLPAFNALGHHTRGRPSPQVYTKLIDTNGKPGEFSTSFTELQRDFIKTRPAKVKNLIRLVKYWYKKYVKKKYHNKPGCLPSKYALELLTIYVWENGSCKEDFKMEEGFRTVLEMIQQYQQLCIYWTTNYDLQNLAIGEYLQRNQAANGPMILDPADPTGNVALGDGWDLLASEAEECLRRIYGSIAVVPSWGVQPYRPICVAVKSMTGTHFSFQGSPNITVRQVKDKIQQQWKISVSQQRLMIQTLPMGKEELIDTKKLLDYGIFDDVTLCMLTTELQPIHILVKNLDGRNIPYEAKLNETVLQLKQKIQIRQNVQVDQQRLMFCERQLEDQYSMEYYQIKEGSTIILLLRLRGGRGIYH